MFPNIAQVNFNNNKKFKIVLFFENLLLFFIPDVLEVRGERGPNGEEIFRIQLRIFLSRVLKVS